MPFLADMHIPFLTVMMLPLAGLGFGLVITLITHHFRNQEAIRQHETARIALEHGQPVPTFSDPWGAGRRTDPTQEPTKGWAGLLIGGFVNIAVGIGLYYMLVSIPGAYVARWAGLIPGLVGVALVLSALIVGLTSRNQDKGGPSPMS